MPGLLFHQLTVVTCPHAGPLTVTVPGQVRVRVSGQTVATADVVSAFTVCPLLIAPCTTVVWANFSTRVKASGKPVVLYEAALGPGNGMTNGVPPAPPTVMAIQSRVRGL
ncbi:hypothetical protein GCM10022247_29220 [Allokutzneria multivorans]|uniref:Uncharacterized protein n=1 Tax=Allokutzneria multivorans TaxID=1142134 RepID=A0ABP7S2G4_9PSEU